MFGNKKNIQASTTNKPYIRTMQQDLVGISFSGNNPPSNEEGLAINNKSGESAENLSAKNTGIKPLEKTSNPSPFLSEAPIQELYPSQESKEKAHQMQLEPPREPITFTNIPPENNASSNISDDNQKHKKNKKIGTATLITISILIIAIIAAPIFYYFAKKNNSEENISLEKNEPTDEPDEKEIVAITPVLEKYSIQQPNYFKIDMSNSNPEQIRTALKDLLLDIEKTTNTTLLEFIITDSNNNPISFPIFAIAANITFSNEIKANFEEDFSFFVFNDNGDMRLGLSLTPKNEPLALDQLHSQESSLLSNLVPLYLSGEAVEIKSEDNFKSSHYKNHEIRYINISKEKNISLDYTSNKKNIILATSKETMRAIIDKISSNQSTENSSTIEAN